MKGGDIMALNEMLKQTREFLGLTQTEVAKRAGISRVSVGNYERGTRTPSSTVLSRLANALHTSPDYLLGKDPFFDLDEKTSTLYYQYLQDPNHDHFFDEILERYGYIIEPSIFDYSNDEEKLIQADNWTHPEKQYYNIIHGNEKIKVTPQEAFDFSKNIKKAMEFEWYKLKSKPPTTE